MSVVIETTVGDFTVDLFVNERPRTFQSNFIAQTGDPTGTGKGGESIFRRLYGDQAMYFETESKPRLKHIQVGTLSMVNNGSNMLGSQFFITLGESLDYLDAEHCVFGVVAEGHETLVKLNTVVCDKNDRPLQDILITHTVVLHDPYDDPPGLTYPESSPLVTLEMLKSDRIGAHEEVDDTKGKTAEEIEEEVREKEAKARAKILEMVGDLRDADEAPPENILFVCKLNPVTTDEDLEIIFSRFGEIKSCEIIRDHKTGESLQYAFIEFGNQKSCEDAYFKMDNVLIDERRIHVDFSQSVAKLRWKGKGRGVEHIDNPGNNDRKRSNFAIKERNKERSDSRYQLLLDDDKETSDLQVREHKKEKGSRKDRERSKNNTDNGESRHRRRRSKDRSRSRERHRSKDRSKPKDHKHFRQRSRSREHKQSKDRSNSKERHYRQRSRSPKRTKYSHHSPSRHSASTKNRSDYRHSSDRHHRR